MTEILFIKTYSSIGVFPATLLFNTRRGGTVHLGVWLDMFWPEKVLFMPMVLPRQMLFFPVGLPVTMLFLPVTMLF